MIAQHVYYRGNVQGVGFRDNAARCAADGDVAGFVRNLPDGRVELLAQGAAKEVRALLDAIGQSMGNYIHEVEVNEAAVDATLTEFAVRH